MFRFEHITNLYFLLGLIPLSIILYLGWRWYSRQKRLIGDTTLIDQLTLHVSQKKRIWKQVLSILTFSLLIIAWANPQWGAKREKVKSRSTDIFIAFDISNSMYCADVAPNRLEQARKFALDLTQKLRGERIGLILFAGSAYLQMPLTTDYAAAQIFLRSAGPNLASTQGTSFSEVFETAREGFTQDRKYHRALIIISDGEDHDVEAIEAAKAANEEGMLVFTVGVGTAQGSFIPINNQGTNDWKRDQNGQPVRTQLNETLLMELAQSGGGDYFYLNGTTSILETLDQKISQLEKREFEERSFTAYESYFQPFLALSILCIVGHWMLENLFFRRKKLF